MSLTCEPGQKIEFEKIVDEINGKTDDIGFGKPGWVLTTNATGSGYEWKFFDVDCKVDKITGKGLSTNDLTNDLYAGLVLAMRNSHNHSNKAVLDLLNVDPTCNALSYNGVVVGAKSGNLNTLDGTFVEYQDGTVVISAALILEDYTTPETWKIFANINLLNELDFELGSIESVQAMIDGVSDEICGNYGITTDGVSTDYVNLKVVGSGVTGSKTDISSLVGSVIYVTINCIKK